MIKETKGKNRAKIYVYEAPSLEEKEERFNRLINLFSKFACENEIDGSKVEFDFKLVLYPVSF